MNTINNYFNPFSNQFKESTKDFENLSTVNKTVAVAAAIIGAIISPFLLFTGSFALFQLSVKWLKDGENNTANSVNQLSNQQKPFCNTNNNNNNNNNNNEKNIDYSVLYSSDSDSDHSTDSDSDSSVDDNEGIDLDNSSQTMQQYDIHSYSEYLERNNGTGFEKVTYTDDSTYDGQLVKWKRHGNGTYTRKGIKYSNSQVGDRRSTWANDELSYGYIEKNGSSYKGEIENWQANGEGVLLDKDHNCSEGTFKDGKLFNGVKTISNSDGTATYEKYEQGIKVAEQNKPFTNGVVK